MDIAGKNGCSRVWLITTNDNIHAIRYYQRFGFALKGVYIDALDESRKLKPLSRSSATRTSRSSTNLNSAIHCKAKAAVRPRCALFGAQIWGHDH